MSNKKPSSFTSFIGVSVTALIKEGYSPEMARKIVAANLMEEYMKLAIKEDDSYDYDVLEILLKAMKHVFDIEKQRMTPDAFIPEVASEIGRLESFSKYLESRIEKKS